MIEYSRETYESMVAEVSNMLPAFYGETGTYTDIPLRPNLAMYERALNAGAMRIYAARGGGALVGFAIYVIMASHPHYQGQPWATSNLFYIDRAYRGQGAGFGLLDFIERDLVGFVMQTATSIDNPELGELLNRQGHRPVETIYSKRL